MSSHCVELLIRVVTSSLEEDTACNSIDLAVSDVKTRFHKNWKVEILDKKMID